MRELFELVSKVCRGKVKLSEKVAESSIDYPQQDLDAQVWYRLEDGTYALHPDVKNKILAQLKLYQGFNLLELADELHVVGSITTNLYSEKADIDVHVVTDEDKLPKGKTPDEWVAGVFKFYKESSSEDRFVGLHPIEVYLQLDKNQDLMSDGVYDLLNDSWIKGPTFTDLSYDPYSVFLPLLADVREIVSDVDLILGELKRDVIDYEVIKQAVAKLPKENKNKLFVSLKDKLVEIEDNLRELMVVKKDWLKARKNAAKPTTPEEALEDVELAKKWLDTNAVFKFLSRYQYMKLIQDLEGVMKDDVLDDTELGQLRSLLGISNV